jgi:hypothetical protein
MDKIMKNNKNYVYEQWLNAVNKEEFINTIKTDKMLTETLLCETSSYFFRINEYGEIGSQLDMIYKDIENGIFGEKAKESTWFNFIKNIKAKFPKPE